MILQYCIHRFSSEEKLSVLHGHQRQDRALQRPNALQAEGGRWWSLFSTQPADFILHQGYRADLQGLGFLPGLSVSTSETSGAGFLCHSE